MFLESAQNHFHNGNEFSPFRYHIKFYPFDLLEYLSLGYPYRFHNDCRQLLIIVDNNWNLLVPMEQSHLHVMLYSQSGMTKSTINFQFRTQSITIRTSTKWTVK